VAKKKKKLVVHKVLPTKAGDEKLSAGPSLPKSSSSKKNKKTKKTATPSETTMGAVFDQALVQSPATAKLWFMEQAARIADDSDMTPAAAVEFLRSSLANFASYYGFLAARKIYSLYGAESPIYRAADYFADVVVAFDTRETSD